MGAYHYERGDQIIVQSDHTTGLLSGTITGRCREQGRNIYDYIDHFGCPRWCAEEDICVLCNRHRSD